MRSPTWRRTAFPTRCAPSSRSTRRNSGADIPLGIQYWLWFFSDQSTEAAANLASLDTPAARQLLVYHHTDPPGGGGQADPLRTALMSEIAAVGD